MRRIAAKPIAEINHGVDPITELAGKVDRLVKAGREGEMSPPASRLDAAAEFAGDIKSITGSGPGAPNRVGRRRLG